ncbi:MAG: hypothetical protein E5Y74_30950, partial [Mesorhizobium sp.]
MKAFLLASFVALSAAPAIAADMMTAPVDTPEWTWQGPYAGVFGAGTLEHYKIYEPGAQAGATHNV